MLVSRLREDAAKRVLLLEAGSPDRSLWLHLPIGYGQTVWSATYNWRFETVPTSDFLILEDIGLAQRFAYSCVVGASVGANRSCRFSYKCHG